MGAILNSRVTSNIYNYSSTSTGSITVTVPNQPYSVNWSSGLGVTGSAVDSKMTVKGDAHFEGEIYCQGVSLRETLEKINDRLAILQPDPEKLEQFEALRKAYEHYKLMEKLCQLPNKGNVK